MFIHDQHVEDQSSDNEEDKGQDGKIVSNSEAVEYFKKCLSWMERQKNVDATMLYSSSARLPQATTFCLQSSRKTYMYLVARPGDFLFEI